MSSIRTARLGIAATLLAVTGVAHAQTAVGTVSAPDLTVTGSATETTFVRIPITLDLPDDATLFGAQFRLDLPNTTDTADLAFTNASGAMIDESFPGATYSPVVLNDGRGIIVGIESSDAENGNALTAGTTTLAGVDLIIAPGVEGTFTLFLPGTNSATSLFGDNFDFLPTDVADGSITIVIPEPALGTPALLGLLALRRRRVA